VKYHLVLCETRGQAFRVMSSMRPVVSQSAPIECRDLIKLTSGPHEDAQGVFAETSRGYEISPELLSDLRKIANAYLLFENNPDHPEARRIRAASDRALEKRMYEAEISTWGGLDHAWWWTKAAWRVAWGAFGLLCLVGAIMSVCNSLA
jgi:hypothetical protein